MSHIHRHTLHTIYQNIPLSNVSQWNHTLVRYDNQNASIRIANRLASRIIFALMVCQPAIYFRVSEGITRRFSRVRAKLWKTYFLETYGGIRRRIPFQWNLGEKPPGRELYVFPRKIFEARSCEFFLRINTPRPDWIYNLVVGRHDGTHAREKFSLGKITSSTVW